MADIINDEITAVLEPTEAEQQLQIPDELPLLPLRDIVIYPFMIVPLFVSREKSIRAVDEALGPAPDDPADLSERILIKKSLSRTISTTSAR